MNRIIIIGNGFDLSHGLKTSYADFIDWYWNEWGKRLLGSSKNCEEDEFFSFKLLENSMVEKWCQVAEWHFHDAAISSHDFIGKVRKDHSLCLINSKSVLFSTICKLRETAWVDIENVYYELLSSGEDQPKKLNDDLDIVRERLVEYLSIVQKGIDEGMVREDLKKVMFEPLDLRDMSLSLIERWITMFEMHHEYSSDEWEKIAKDYNIDEQDPEYLKLQNYVNEEKGKGEAKKDRNAMMAFIKDQLVSMGTSSPEIREEAYERLRNFSGPKLLYLPDNVLLLNFNYLTTADMYFSDKENRFVVNHIHGELANPNSVIFGYGDELVENYKWLSEKNDNEYLRNIKSIKYLEAPNYRNLLGFIESDAYQIYIMGHACGNSDRTLLNTLFEHKNCVSIKPLYHRWDDGTDNYMGLIQNISRNFTNMKLMRDRVVNKTFCDTL